MQFVDASKKNGGKRTKKNPTFIGFFTSIETKNVIV